MSSKLKMCQSCRGLIAASESTCPLCGVESHYASRSRSISEADSTFSWSVTMMLITANILVYIFSLWLTMRFPEQSGRPRVTDILAPSGTANYFLGLVMKPLVLAGEYWRLLSYGFLHGDLIHILLNSFGLIQVGRMAEEVYGGAKYFVLYVVSIISGGVVVVLANSGAVGASAAVFGLIGAMAVYGYKRGDAFGRALKASMVQWLLYGFLMSLMPGISFAGHAGGLIGGAAMAWLLEDESTMRQSFTRTRLWQILGGLAVLLTVGSLLLSGRSVWARSQAEIAEKHYRAAWEAAERFEEWEDLKPDAKLDDYRGTLGSAITVLEKTEAGDGEAIALSARLLKVLHERQEKLKNAKTIAEAYPTTAQEEEIEKIMSTYNAWFHRRITGLGLSHEYQWGNPQKNSSPPPASQGK
jgi:rhomboid protease GluP